MIYINKRQIKEQDINIINPQFYEEKRTIDNAIWVMPLVSIILVCIITMGLVIHNVYNKEEAILELEVDNINDTLDEEFNVAINSIELNGYMEVFEQYMKTVDDDAKASIYYDNAIKTLDNITNVSDNIVTTFMIAFNNKTLVASGINNEIIDDYNYNNEKWYNYKKIVENKMYVSKGFKLKEVSDEKLFAIVRPIVDSMNDEPLGVVAFCYKEDYLKEIFIKTINNRNLETVIFTDDGTVLLNTSSVKDSKPIVDDSKSKYIIKSTVNESLNWTVELYQSYGDILFKSAVYLITIIILFAIIIITYCNLVRHLCSLKVIYRKEKIVEEVEEEIALEKTPIEEEELAIEEVLGLVETDDSISDEDEVIISGEIIYNKK